MQYWDGEQWTQKYCRAKAARDEGPTRERAAEDERAEKNPREAETAPSGERRFRSLHVIASIYGVLGWLVAIFGTIVVVAAAAGAGDSDTDPGVIAVAGLLGVAFYVLLMLCLSEAIRLALAIEENTRSTVALQKPNR